MKHIKLMAIVFNSGATPAIYGFFFIFSEQIYLRPVKENDSLSGVFMQFEDSQIISDRRRAHFDKWNEVFKVLLFIIYESR